MATYQVKAPDGKTITLQGPAGASQEDIIAQAQALYERLLPEAIAASKAAWCPHSDFPVGAALLTADDQIIRVRVGPLAAFSSSRDYYKRQVKRETPDGERKVIRIARAKPVDNSHGG